MTLASRDRVFVLLEWAALLAAVVLSFVENCTLVAPIAAVGGTLQFITAPNAGCTIRASVPASAL